MAEGGCPIINNFIQCTNCNMLLRTDKIETFRDYHSVIPLIEFHLDDMSNTIAGYEYADALYFDTVNVPIELNCPLCNKDFETVAQVSASPIWNYDAIDNGRVASICGFQEIDILNISSSFKITLSLQECFKNDHSISNPEDFDFNAEHAIDSVVKPSYIILKIIAKTKMSKGFCYLGLDESTGRIFRPIFNTKKCCWPRNEQLKLGMKYTLSVIANPDQMKNFTPCPHRNEDMIVNGFSIFETPDTGVNSVYSSLSELAKSDVCEVFNAIRLRTYVEEKTNCSSAGIIRSEAMIKFDDFMKKDYCHIRCPSGKYSFPITSSQFDPIGAEYRDAIIVLGLGRPYKGRRGQHDPARCIVLAVGIYLPNVQKALPPNQ